MFFKNAYLEISKDEIAAHRYEDFKDEYIWSDSIIERNVDINLYKTEDCQSEYDQLIRNVCKDEEDWYNALKCSIGYMAHDYKDCTNTKAVIFCDEELSIADDSNGGTGKSLVCKGLKYVRNTEIIDGKNYKTDSPFIFQKININTEIAIIDDVRKEFDFESLLSAITSDLTIEKKNQHPITIPFENSPKFFITTNYTIDGNGNSFDRRKHEIEFSNYYSRDFTPEDDFGHTLFKDWNNEEWSRFYKTLAVYMQSYLRNGLVKYQVRNLCYRRIVNSSCQEFVDFIEDNIEFGKEYNKQTLLSDFKKQYPDFESFRSNTFTKWLKSYATSYKLKYSERKSNMNRFFCIGGQNA
jgi:hypothetical protein